jgi:hypothetical protein
MTNVKKKDLHRPRKMATKDRDKAGKVAKGKGKAKKVIAPVDTESQPIYFSSVGMRDPDTVMHVTLA